MRATVFGASFGCFLASSASAAIFTYEYQGGVLDEVFGLPEEYRQWEGASYKARIVIDETLLGQSLRDAHIDLYFEREQGDFGNFPPPDGDPGPIEGILSFGWELSGGGGLGSRPGGLLDDFAVPVAGANLTIKTDADGNIEKGCYQYADGPPDGIFGCFEFDSITGESFPSSARGPSGSWSTVSIEGPLAPIPLPWGGPLGALALGALFLYRKSRGVPT